MNKIKILYVDDSIESQLSKFLGLKLNGLLATGGLESQVLVESKDFKYVNISYEEFLRKEEFKKCDILIVDSRLFENGNAGGKLTGEALKMIIKKSFPFKETIIVSQNDDLSKNIGYVSKFQQIRGRNDYIEHYKTELLPNIKSAIKETIANREVFNQIQENEIFDQNLIDEMDALLDGDNEYSQLTKQDVDDMITKFNQIIEDYNNE